MGKQVNVVLNLKDAFSSKLKQVADKLGKTEKEVKKATNAVKRFQNQLGKGMKDAAIVAGAGIAAISIGLATVGMSWVKLASDSEETNNKIDVVFGKSSKSLKKWSETSISKMGLAGQSALDSAALFGDMGRGMGISEQKAASMAMGLTQLSADLASFKNVRQDIAKTALNGIYSGETESLKQLGIVMTQANLQEYAGSIGIKKKIDKMKEAEKVQLRYNYVLAKTKLAQGDFERTGGGAANQLRMFEELKIQIGSNLGKIFLPTFTKGLKQVNSLLIGNMPKIQAVATQAFNGIGNALGFVTNNLNWIIPVAGAAFTSIMAFTAISKVNAAFEALKATQVALNTVQGVWNALLLANPIGVVAAGIGIVVGGLIVLYQHSEKFRGIVAQVGNFVMPILKFIGSFLKLIGLAVLSVGKILISILVPAFQYIVLPIAKIAFFIFQWVTPLGLVFNFVTRLINHFGGLQNIIKNVGAFMGNMSAGLSNFVFGGKPAKTKKLPGHALGTSYFAGGATRINEGGRSETAVLPSGSQIIPHDIAKKSSSGLSIKIGDIIIQGNIIGDEKYADYLGNHIAGKITKALANI